VSVDHARHTLIFVKKYFRAVHQIKQKRSQKTDHQSLRNHKIICIQKQAYIKSQIIKYIENNFFQKNAEKAEKDDDMCFFSIQQIRHKKRRPESKDIYKSVYPKHRTSDAVHQQSNNKCQDCSFEEVKMKTGVNDDHERHFKDETIGENYIRNR
jgi:hypothetical protein